MNKVLHVLVYVFLVLAAAALYFELQLNAKRSELTDRCRLQEGCIVKLARTIEKGEPDKNAVFEMKMDSSPVEARLVDAPDMTNLLEEYPASLEQANLETYNFDGAREQLRSVHQLDPDGKPVMDGDRPMTDGSQADKMLGKLFESAKAQQSRLNSTRAALTDLRGKFETVVSDVNRMKAEARQDKVTIDEQNAKIAEIEAERTALESAATKAKAQVDELSSEVASLKDEVNTAKDETEAAKEDLAKAKTLVEQLKKLLQESIQTTGQQNANASANVAVSTISAGSNKGKVVDADNENMFAIVEFSNETMKELKGEDLSKPLPQIEFGVRREGYKGAAGEFVGRIRIRQEVKGKNYVICDILGAWEQDKLAANDVLFAD